MMINALYELVFYRYLIIVSILLNGAAALLFVYRLFIRRSVMLPTGFVHRMFASMLLVLFVVVACACCFVYGNNLLTSGWVLPLFAFSFTSFLASVWNSLQTTGLQARGMELVDALVGVIESGDPNLDGHSLHVRNLAMLIYSVLPLKDRFAINPENLQYAALLLDIGKLGIPRQIIKKSGKLTPDEWDLMRRHPEIGMKILESIPSFKLILPWIQYHHERVDGGGYYRLQGNDIPLPARILAVADTYSALTMSRSYKASRTYEEAVSELRLVAGSQLDPDLVELFCSIPMYRVELCMADVHRRMERYQCGVFR